MKFEINGLRWEIVEESQEEIKNYMNSIRANTDENVKAKLPRYYGVTHSDTLQIVLDRELPYDRKKRTLLHELAHCYVTSFITHEEKTYDEELLADIISNSHEIIGNIVSNYFMKNYSKTENEMKYKEGDRVLLKSGHECEIITVNEFGNPSEKYGVSLLGNNDLSYVDEDFIIGKLED